MVTGSGAFVHAVSIRLCLDKKPATARTWSVNVTARKDTSLPGGTRLPHKDADGEVKKQWPKSGDLLEKVAAKGLVRTSAVIKPRRGAVSLIKGKVTSFNVLPGRSVASYQRVIVLNRNLRYLDFVTAFHIYVLLINYSLESLIWFALLLKLEISVKWSKHFIRHKYY